MIYQHEARGADKAITSAIDAHVEAERGREGGSDDGQGGMLVPGMSAEQRKGSYPYPFIAQDDDRPRGEVLGNLLKVGLDDG